MTPTVSLSGFKEVDQMLGELPKATGKRILRKIGIDALEPVAAAMRARAPVADRDLVDSITVGTKLAKSQRRFSGFNGGFKDPHIVVVHAGPGTHPQAITQEIGTINHAPQAFVFPAWEMTRIGVLNYVAGEIGDVVLKAASRHRKKAG